MDGASADEQVTFNKSKVINRDNDDMMFMVCSLFTMQENEAFVRKGGPSRM